MRAKGQSKSASEPANAEYDPTVKTPASPSESSMAQRTQKLGVEIWKRREAGALGQCTRCNDARAARMNHLEGRVLANYGSSN
jgi:hypothetical protein